MGAVADKMDDYPFAITSEDSIFTENKVEKDGVVLFKKFDEGRADLEGEVTDESLTKFISGNALPLVVEFNQDTAQKIFSGRSSPTCSSSCPQLLKTLMPRL